MAMLSMSSPSFRFFVAGLLAAAMPLCCCTGRLAAGAVGAARDGEAARHTSVDDGASARHSCCSGKPVEEPQPCEDEAPCRCDVEKPTKTLPGKALAVDAGADVLALLPRLAVEWHVPADPASSGVTRRGVVRPPATLLRLHCALII